MKKNSRRLTKKRLLDIWSSTSACYAEAAEEIGFNNFQIRAWLVEDLISDEEAEVKSNQIDELYRGKLCCLPSDVIEDIIQANTKGLQRRSQKTINSLITELLERQLKDEKSWFS